MALSLDACGFFLPMWLLTIAKRYGTVKRMPIIMVQDRLTGRQSMPVEAELFGIFAVHPTIDGLPDAFTLTHVPSGFAYLSGVTKAAAEACARDINAGSIDWSIIKEPSDMTPAHKAQGKAMREKYNRW